MTRLGLMFATILLITGLGACGQKDERKSVRTDGQNPPEERDQEQGDEDRAPANELSLALLFANCAGIGKGEVASLDLMSRKNVTQFCRDLGATKFKRGINNTLEPAKIN